MKDCDVGADTFDSLLDEEFAKTLDRSRDLLGRGVHFALDGGHFDVMCLLLW